MMRTGTFFALIIITTIAFATNARGETTTVVSGPMCDSAERAEEVITEVAKSGFNFLQEIATIGGINAQAGKTACVILPRADLQISLSEQPIKKVVAGGITFDIVEFRITGVAIETIPEPTVVLSQDERVWYSFRPVASAEKAKDKGI